MKTILKLVLIVAVTSNISCSSGNEDPKGISNQEEVESMVNSNLELPPGSFQVDEKDVQIDNSITVGNNSGAVMPLAPGNLNNAQIPFSAPNGNVSAIGMRFGQSGPINFVPISTNGATSGTGSFQFRVDSKLCSQLSKICHDIRCYEFAYTSEGTISKSNITQLALTCGNCDEPSCQGVIDAALCDLDCQAFKNGDYINSDIYVNYINAKNEYYADIGNEQKCENFWQAWNSYLNAVVYCIDDDIWNQYYSELGYASKEAYINDLTEIYGEVDCSN